MGKGPNPIIGQPTEAAQMDYLVTDEEGALVQGMRSEERGTPVCFGIGFWDLMAPELLQNFRVCGPLFLFYGETVGPVRFWLAWAAASTTYPEPPGPMLSV